MLKMQPIVYKWSPRFDPYHSTETMVKTYVSQQWFEISGFQWKHGYALHFDLWREESKGGEAVCNKRINEWDYYDHQFPPELTTFFGPLTDGQLTGRFAEQMLFLNFIMPVFFQNPALLEGRDNIVMKYFPIEFNSRSPLKEE